MNHELHSNGVAPQEPNGLGGGGASGSDESDALRWRAAILRLSEALMDAADSRRELSPILLEALHNALDNLLVHGEDGDLMVLEEWLAMEEESHNANWRKERRASDRRAHERRFAERRFADRRYRVIVITSDRRTVEQRRAAARRVTKIDDRRRTARREPRDWQFEEIKLTDTH